MSEWSDLPNAQHIDRVLASVKAHPEIWRAAFDPAWVAFYSVAHDVANDEIYNAARGTTWYATRQAVRHDAAFDVTWGAIKALIAYDDCDQYLNMPSDKLRVWAYLSEHPAAVLLLPAVVAFERIKELESV